MADSITVVAGIPIPSTSPAFLVGVAFHVVVGIACIVVGVLAMLSTKGRGRHSSFGTTYYWCLFAVFLSASVLAAVRWTEDYHLFILGVLSFGAASGGRLALRRRWWKSVYLHVIGMGSSYVLPDRVLRRQRKELAGLAGVAGDGILAAADGDWTSDYCQRAFIPSAG